MRREGRDLTIVAWLSAARMAGQAAAELVGEDIDAEVIDPRTLVPFDTAAVVRSVSKTGRLLIAHEAVRRGGFGAEIAATVAASEAFSHLKAPLARVANLGVPVPYSPHLQTHVIPTANDIAAAARRLMGARP